MTVTVGPGVVTVTVVGTPGTVTTCGGLVIETTKDARDTTRTTITKMARVLISGLKGATETFTNSTFFGSVYSFRN